MKIQFLLCLLLTSWYVQHPEAKRNKINKKVALVVGVSAYDHLSPLPTSALNALDMSNSLVGMQYDVRTLLNPDKQVFRRTIDSIAHVLDTSSVLMLYFSGHGVSCMGENYLLPSDAVISTGRNVRRWACSVNDLLTSINNTGHPAACILILDACCPTLTTRPEKRSFDCSFYGSGSGDPTPNTLIAYSTAAVPSLSDRNSRYTSALLRYIRQPDISFDELLRQTADEVRRETNDAQDLFIVSTMIRPCHIF